MTAINVILQRDAAHIITDSAWYTEDGYLTGFAPKTFVLPHWPGAIATRGPLLALCMLGAVIGLRFKNIDEFEIRAADVLRELVERPDWQDLCACDRAAVDLTVVGWSPRRGRPYAFMIGSTADNDLSMADVADDWEGEVFSRANGYEAAVIPEGQGMTLPIPDASALARYGITSDLDLDRVDPLAFGTKLLCAQREFRDALRPGGDKVYFIGGYVMVTSVTRHTATQTKGASWPDVIGELIDAKPFDLIGASPARPTGGEAARPGNDDASGEPSYAGMSRQQRRAAEKRDRRNRSRAA